MNTWGWVIKASCSHEEPALSGPTYTKFGRRALTAGRRLRDAAAEAPSEREQPQRVDASRRLDECQPAEWRERPTSQRLRRQTVRGPPLSHRRARERDGAEESRVAGTALADLRVGLEDVLEGVDDQLGALAEPRRRVLADRRERSVDHP